MGSGKTIDTKTNPLLPTGRALELNKLEFSGGILFAYNASFAIILVPFSSKFDSLPNSQIRIKIFWFKNNQLVKIRFRVYSSARKLITDSKSGHSIYYCV